MFGYKTDRKLDYPNLVDKSKEEPIRLLNQNPFSHKQTIKPLQEITNLHPQFTHPHKSISSTDNVRSESQQHLVPSKLLKKFSDQKQQQDSIIICHGISDFTMFDTMATLLQKINAPIQMLESVEFSLTGNWLILNYSSVKHLNDMLMKGQHVVKVGVSNHIAVHYSKL